jgi:hypothetical protein
VWRGLAPAKEEEDGEKVLAHGAASISSGARGGAWVARRRKDRRSGGEQRLASSVGVERAREREEGIARG